MRSSMKALSKQLVQGRCSSSCEPGMRAQLWHHHPALAPSPTKLRAHGRGSASQARALAVGVLLIGVILVLPSARWMVLHLHFPCGSDPLRVSLEGHCRGGGGGGAG